MAKLDFNRMRARTSQATTDLAQRDQQIKLDETPATLSLDHISSRLYGDTRPLNPSHVVELALSISALGLLEPVVVDSQHRLLAGGHRLAACRLILATAEARRVMIAQLCEVARQPFSEALKAQLKLLEPSAALAEGVPVRVVRFDSAEDQDRALAIEAAENTQRRDYTRAEIRALYGRLVEAGYTDRRGRPKQGERQAKPAIAMIIGRSLRTVERMLQDQRQDQARESLRKGLRRLRAGLVALERASTPQPPAVEALRARLSGDVALERLIDEALSALDEGAAP